MRLRKRNRLGRGGGADEAENEEQMGLRRRSR